MKAISSACSSAKSAAASERAVQSRAEAERDLALVQRFNGGDESAFVEIMDRYRAKIFSVAISLLHNHGDAQEVTQDTFVRAFRSLRKFRGDSSLATWLYRIALNLARNRYWHFFRRRRHTTISLDRTVSDERDTTMADLVAADAPDPAQESARAEFARLVAECLDRLDGQHREILTMRSSLHLPYAEIGAALGIHVGTVKSRIARARENLRKLLTVRCPEFDRGTDPDDYFLPPRGGGLVRLAGT